MKTIQLVILPNGQLRLQTHGFSGSQCRQASRLLEQALGRRTSEQLTDEFYKTRTQQSDRLQQGQS